jgi:hypothetical protein
VEQETHHQQPLVKATQVVQDYLAAILVALAAALAQSVEMHPEQWPVPVVLDLLRQLSPLLLLLHTPRDRSVEDLFILQVVAQVVAIADLLKEA